MPDTSSIPQRRWYAISSLDLLFAGIALLVFVNTNRGMMDGPGLGWHLRIADQMWESRGFLYDEVFCLETQGRPWVTYAWLGDIVMRLCYAWGGLNGIGVLFSLSLALVIRLLYTRMLNGGVPGLVALAWSFIALWGTQLSWSARPNVFSFVGIALTVAICERFYNGAISKATTLWLLPLFLLWTNVHSGFLGGALILALTCLVDGTESLLAETADRRRAARGRLAWWTVLGVCLFAVTLINPYGYGLYTWTIAMLRDPFIQRASTLEWRATDFSQPGFGKIEMLILLFPALAALSRRKASLLAIMWCVVWLHFALTGKRYIAVWVIVAVPTLASLSCGLPWFRSLGTWFSGRYSSDVRSMFAHHPGRQPYFASFVFAGLLLAGSRWLPPVSAHHPSNMPTAALDYLLSGYQGERVFHSANWGGYLNWHGWDLQPRFRPWIDDRIDVHGQEHTDEYYQIMNAKDGWDDLLDLRRIDTLCIPADSALAQDVQDNATWTETFRDDAVVILRRSTARQEAPSGRLP